MVQSGDGVIGSDGESSDHIEWVVVGTTELGATSEDKATEKSKTADLGGMGLKNVEETGCFVALDKARAKEFGAKSKAKGIEGVPSNVKHSVRWGREHVSTKVKCRRNARIRGEGVVGLQHGVEGRKKGIPKDLEVLEFVAVDRGDICDGPDEVAGRDG